MKKGRRRLEVCRLIEDQFDIVAELFFQAARLLDSRHCWVSGHWGLDPNGYVTSLHM